MFGGVYDPEIDFNFENIPKFIEYLIKICCKKNPIDRPKTNVIVEKLERYKDEDLEKLFNSELIDVSPHLIDSKDIYKASIGKIKNSFYQRSTKKLLILVSNKRDLGVICDIYLKNGTEKMRPYIQASKCRNCFPIYGFPNNHFNISFYIEYVHEITNICFNDIETALKCCQLANDLHNLGYIIDINNTQMLFDKNNNALFIPSLYFQYNCSQLQSVYNKKVMNKYLQDATIEASVKEFIDKLNNLTNNLFIKALVELGKIYIDKINFQNIENVLSSTNIDLSSNISVDWSNSNGKIEGEDEYNIYKSTKNPAFIEELIRVEILLGFSNLFSYSRKEDEFALLYHGKSDLSFMKAIYEIENEVIIPEGRKKVKNFKIEGEYIGKHCLVQFLAKDEKKLVLKRYNKNYDINYPSGVKIESWEENDILHCIQEYKEIESLEDCIKRKADILTNEFKTNLILNLLTYHGNYYRLNPHNICIDTKSNEILIVDTIGFIDEEIDEYMAPECSKFNDLSDFEKKNLITYSIGWIAYLFFVQAPEIDEETKRFKPTTFPDDFSQFWKDLITISTRENMMDRPLYYTLISYIKDQLNFCEVDFILVSSKLLNHDDYIMEDPIGAGGETIVYLVNNKATGEKHACKKLKYEIISDEIKKILLKIEKLNDSFFGIKYIGISVNKEKEVFLHMEYVPNGSLSEIISLDRRMKAPSWFNETAKLRLAKEIAEGMMSLHEEGIIHKDLKPENILLDSSNRAKICDFSFIPEDGAATLLFMSPELLSVGEATVKSDVYSFAVTLACLFGGGEMIGSVKKAAIEGFRPSIAVSTPQSIQSVIRKCWQQNPEDRPTFSEIVDELTRADLDDDDLRINSMDEFPRFNPEVNQGILSEDYEYEICDIVSNNENVEHFVRLHMTIQPENMLHIHKYCRLGDKIVLIIERGERMRFDVYLSAKKRVSATRGEKYVSDFISMFELYHKNGFCFGPFSLQRLFFRGRHKSSICFDFFDIPGLVRHKTQTKEEIIVQLPEIEQSREGDVFSFACFVLKIFNCFEKKENGKVSTQPFNRANYKNRSDLKPLIPPRYTCDNIMKRCLNDDPKKRPTFELLFQKLFPVQYRIISNFLSISVSRFSTFSMNKSFRHEDIEFFDLIGQGTYGKVIHAINRATNEDLAVKEFNDISGKRNEDFMLEFVALKAIDHPNIVKIVGASQRKESVHGSRLFMEFAGGGDLRKNMGEPFDIFLVHMLQVSSAMKYLHQRGIVHLDLKPENILIRDDGSAVVADFNTAIHVDIDTHLQSQRGSKGYMSPEILCSEPYSFSTDVFSFGLMASEYFSQDAHNIIREANEKRERPSLDFVPDERLRSLLEFCVDDDRMIRPSFDFICNFIFKKFFKNAPGSEELERLTQIPRIDEDKLNQIRVLASRGSNEAIVEYAKYLLCENSFSDAMHVLLKGANEGDASCQNTLGVLSQTLIAENLVDNPYELIRKAAEQGDKFAMTNYGYILSRKSDRLKESIGLLEQASSKGVAHAGYVLGLIYETKEMDGMTYNERIKKSIEYYRDAAKEGDAFAQCKYGSCLEEGLADDEDGYDCVHYFRLSAYQRCRKGVLNYIKYIQQDWRKKFYSNLLDQLPKGKSHFLWTDEQVFFDEMMSYYIGMLLLDAKSKNRFNFRLNNIFSKLFYSNKNQANYPLCHG